MPSTTFENEVIRVLNDCGLSLGWQRVADDMNMTVEILQARLKRRNLSFDECLKLVHASSSPQLLDYIVNGLELNGNKKFKSLIMH